MVDQGQVLDSDTTASIAEIALLLRDQTGIKLVVVTVDRLDGLTVEDFAEQLFKRLGIGEKEKDNGVLILLSRDDRRVRVEVGYGLESILNDAKAGRLLDEHAVPYLKKNEFGRGIYEGTRAMAQALGAALPEVLSSSRHPALGSTGVVVAAMIFFSAVLTILAVFAKLIMLWRRKTRAGRRAAMLVFDNMTATLVILSPFATAMVGYSEKVPWTGIFLATIPLAWGLLIYWGFCRWAQRLSKWSPRCVACHSPMIFQKTETSGAAAEEGKRLRVAERRELWKCTRCGADKTLIDKVYMGTRSSGGGWSFSRPSSRSGRGRSGGGGSSGGGGASRSF